MFNHVVTRTAVLLGIIALGGCQSNVKTEMPTRYQNIEVMARTSTSITLKFSSLAEDLAIERATSFCNEKGLAAVKRGNVKKFGPDDIYTWDCR